MKWEQDLNIDLKQLVFLFGEHTLLVMHNGKPLTNKSFVDLIQSIK